MVVASLSLGQQIVRPGVGTGLQLALEAGFGGGIEGQTQGGSIRRGLGRGEAVLRRGLGPLGSAERPPILIKPHLAWHPAYGGYMGIFDIQEYYGNES
jgi:hypothetical protein